MDEESRKRFLSYPDITNLEKGFAFIRYGGLYSSGSRIDIFEGKNVLDIGAGWGAGAEFMIRYAGANKVIALDLLQNVYDKRQIDELYEKNIVYIKANFVKGLPFFDK